VNHYFLLTTLITVIWKWNKQRKTLLLLNHILCAMLYPSINLHLPCTTENSTSAKYKLEAKPHGGRRKGRKMLFFVHGNLDLWPWPSNSSEQRTKHVFHGNLVQICSAVPQDISYTNKKHRLTAPKKRNLPQFTACGNKVFHFKIQHCPNNYNHQSSFVINHVEDHITQDKWTMGRQPIHY